eukprot:14059698-Alexandrium_andersonii.AAC.1
MVASRGFGSDACEAKQVFNDSGGRARRRTAGKDEDCNIRGHGTNCMGQRLSPRCYTCNRAHTPGRTQPRRNA